MPTSLIYSHIALYRSAMYLLYGGKYLKRFRDIVDLIGSDARSVCEICFADTIIGEECRSRGIHWTGVDMNPRFCARARRKGFNVLEGDALALDLPDADVFIMAGSLYHFHSELSRLIDRIMLHTQRFILSEPVRNLSSRGGVLGRVSQRYSDPGDGPAAFRYDERSLLEALRGERERLGFRFDVISTGRDMLVTIDRGPGREGSG